MKASDDNQAIDADDEIRPASVSADDAVLRLVISRSDIANDNTEAANKFNTLVVSGRNRLSWSEVTGNKVDADTLEVGGAENSSVVDFDDANMIIKVATNGNYCHVWNNTTDTELVRSERL